MKNTSMILSFGLVKDVAFDSIVGLPKMKQWGGVLDFHNDCFVTKKNSTKFQIQYEATARYLSLLIILDGHDNVLPTSGCTNKATSLLTNTHGKPSVKNCATRCYSLSWKKLHNYFISARLLSTKCGCFTSIMTTSVL